MPINHSYMSTRATIYFDEDLHHLLKIKAAQSGCSVSDLVNQATKEHFIEDLSDIKEWDKRKSEPDASFEQTLRRLKLA